MYENEPWKTTASPHVVFHPSGKDIILSQDWKGYFCDIGLNQSGRSIHHMSLSFPINRICNIITHGFMSCICAKVLDGAPRRIHNVLYIFNALDIGPDVEAPIRSYWCIFILNHVSVTRK